MPFWVVQLIIVAVSILAARALAPKPPQPKLPSVSELDVPTAEEGRSIAVLFGTRTIRSPNVVWYGDFKYKRVKTKTGK